MDLFEVGRGKVRLDTSDFLAQGGEAAVYVKGDRAYKVYHDPTKMVPAGKLQELSVLNHAALVRPEAVLLDRKDLPVGYAMRRITAAHVLCELFNRAFRDRKAVSADAVLALVRKLQAGVQHVHERDVLIVDLNEMNFLLDPTLQEIHFIDVDSYQTNSFPATAIMDSVRDRHAATFSRETDWFSFAVVAFQMFTGIHPFKGKHPVLKDLDARMRANVSVLNSEVKVPAVCQPFSVIPPAYLAWFKAVFEAGERNAPPDARSAPVLVAPELHLLTSSDRLRVRELYRFTTPVLLPLPAAGPHTALTQDGLQVRGVRHPVPADARVVVTPRMLQPVAAWIETGALVLYDVGRKCRITAEIAAEGLTAYADRLYVKQGQSLATIDLLELPAGIRATPRPVANVMEHATRLFDGAALQDVLGSCWVTLFPQPGHTYSIRLLELDGARVVDARFDGGVLIVVAFRNGRYDRLVFRFGVGYSDYDLRVTEDVTPAELNFVTLDSGVCVLLTETGELELFRRDKGSAGVRLVSGVGIDDVRLFRNGSQVLGVRGETLYELSLRLGT